MTKAARSSRYSVHARHGDPRHAQVVDESSFEAAAIAYAEDFSHAHDGEISVVVRDLDSGHEYCFSVDLGSGEAQPCAEAND